MPLNAFERSEMETKDLSLSGRAYHIQRECSTSSCVKRGLGRCFDVLSGEAMRWCSDSAVWVRGTTVLIVEALWVVKWDVVGSAICSSDA